MPIKHKKKEKICQYHFGNLIMTNETCTHTICPVVFGSFINTKQWSVRQNPKWTYGLNKIVPTFTYLLWNVPHFFSPSLLVCFFHIVFVLWQLITLMSVPFRIQYVLSFLLLFYCIIYFHWLEFPICHSSAHPLIPSNPTIAHLLISTDNNPFCFWPDLVKGNGNWSHRIDQLRTTIVSMCRTCHTHIRIKLPEPFPIANCTQSGRHRPN